MVLLLLIARFFLEWAECFARRMAALVTLDIAVFEVFEELADGLLR